MAAIPCRVPSISTVVAKKNSGSTLAVRVERFVDLVEPVLHPRVSLSGTRRFYVLVLQWKHVPWNFGGRRSSDCGAFCSRLLCLSAPEAFCWRGVVVSVGAADIEICVG